MADGVDFGLDFERERLLRRVRDGQLVRADEDGGRIERARRRARSRLATRPSPSRTSAASGRPADSGEWRAARRPASPGVELDIKIDLVDQIVGRPVIFQANGLGAVGTHQNLNLRTAKRGAAIGTPDHRACIDEA